jgi:MFS family permease
LLPDLDRIVGLTDLQLGALAAAFGFARMVVDIPVGLFVARHLRRALVLSPLLLTAGILAIGSGGPFPVLLGGRVLMGAAHALGMVAWLTAILRYQSGPALGRALNAVEFTAMIGMLGGAGAVGLLPKAWSWNVVLLVACAPQLIGIALGPLLAGTLPATDAASTRAMAETATASSSTRRGRAAVALAFAAGAAVATAYSTFELSTVPLRGSRELGLERTGVARLLILQQTADLVALLPVGVLADRVGAGRLLVGVTSIIALATLLAGFGGLGALTAGAALFGIGMAGWMLPLAVVRRETPASRIAWRTALYRVGVDGGMFLGPFLAGVLGPSAWMLGVALAAVLLVLGVLIAVVERGTVSAAA